MLRNIRRLLGVLFATSVFTVIFALAAEGVVRIRNGGARKLVPYTYSDGMPLLPESSSLVIQMGEDPPFEIRTDLLGRRVDSQAVPGPMGLCVMGDSQALGYGLSFGDTFAARIATEFGRENRVSIFAAPASDPEKLIVFLGSHPEYLEQVSDLLLCINLGNDLDEIYLEGDTRGVGSDEMENFLMRHSYLYDFVVLQRQTIALDRQHSPPGLNRILFALNAIERVQLTSLLADKVREFGDSLPKHVRLHLAVFPADYQVSHSEFQKYRRFYRSEEEFLKMVNELPNYARQMQVLQEYLIACLKRRLPGIEIVDIFQSLSGGDNGTLFHHSSHHLTKEGHARVAVALARQHFLQSAP